MKTPANIKFYNCGKKIDYIKKGMGKWVLCVFIVVCIWLFLFSVAFKNEQIQAESAALRTFYSLSAGSGSSSSTRRSKGEMDLDSSGNFYVHRFI